MADVKDRKELMEKIGRMMVNLNDEALKVIESMTLSFAAAERFGVGCDD